MIRIKADLTSLDRDGMLQAHLSLLSVGEGDVVRGVQSGDRLTVVDLFGSDSFPAAVVTVDGSSNIVTLDVDWDSEEQPSISGEVRPATMGLRFTAVGNTEARENRISSSAPYMPIAV